MIIDHHASKMNLEVVIFVKNFGPLNIVIDVIQEAFWVWGAWNMSCLVISSDLEIATVFAETHRELAIFNDPLLVHHVVDWFKAI